MNNIEYKLKELSREDIDNLIMKALKRKELCRLRSKRYYATEKGKKQLQLCNKIRYYTRNDIYQPEYNKDGKIEKKHKRPVVKE